MVLLRVFAWSRVKNSFVSFCDVIRDKAQAAGYANTNTDVHHTLSAYMHAHTMLHVMADRI